MEIPITNMADYGTCKKFKYATDDISVKIETYFKTYIHDSLRYGILGLKSVHSLVILNGSQLAKMKNTFLTCTCHEIYREEAVGLKSSNYT